MKSIIIKPISITLSAAFIMLPSVFFHADTASAGGDGNAVETKIDPRDKYLNRFGEVVSEGMPYQFMVPGKGYSRTKIDPRDKYLNRFGEVGSEGMPYQYMVPEKEYKRTRLGSESISYEEMLSEDPSGWKIHQISE